MLFLYQKIKLSCHGIKLSNQLLKP
jgi:hypothetical protein